MSKLLLKLFVKNYENINDIRVRGKYGTLSSLVGVFCNIILFIIKYVMGTISNSISIISDAFNNLSDCASCIVTLFGYKMASKPADKDHPFGHGRIEYITSLVIAAFIMTMGMQLFVDSVDKIIHPSQVKYSTIVLVSLIISILIKVWMSIFNTTLGNKVDSMVMLATAKDSRNDVWATLGTVLAIIASLFTEFPIDGIMGLIVSLIILKGGFEITKDTVDELIGKPADKEIVDSISEFVTKNDSIYGMHDLILHNYGPGKTLGSCHIEVRSDENFLKAHDIIDNLENELYYKFNIIMTIHMDPIEIDNEIVNSLRNRVKEIIKDIDEVLSFHDFRVVSGDTHTNIIFDVVVPYECKYTDKEIKEKVDKELKDGDTLYYTVIKFDREYI